MHTSVRTEILDRSISGDKIYDGIIDRLQGLYVDKLAVPAEGTADGSINGTGFSVGNTEAIGVMFAESIGAIGDNATSAVYDSGWVPRAYLATSAGRGYLELWNSTARIVHLSGHSSCYINYKFLVGKATPSQPSYIMEVEGGLYVDTMFAPYVSATTGIFNVLNFLHGSTWTDLDAFYTDYLLIETKVNDISDNLTITSGLTDLKAAEIIANQAVATSSDVQFPSVRINSASATHQIVDFVHAEPTTGFAPATFATISLGSPLVVQVQRTNKAMTIFLDDWSVLNSSAPVSGILLYDLSDSVFTDWWAGQESNVDLYTTGPIVSLDNASPYHHQTIAVLSKLTLELQIHRLDLSALYASYLNTWTWDNGDNAKMESWSLIFQGENT